MSLNLSRPSCAKLCCYVANFPYRNRAYSACNVVDRQRAKQIMNVGCRMDGSGERGEPIVSIEIAPARTSNNYGINAKPLISNLGIELQ